MIRIIFSEYPTACSTQEQDESITYFQIQDNHGNALESSGQEEIFFSPNEYKESQFWYFQKQPNSDFGYIGSKLYFGNYRLLSVLDPVCKYEFLILENTIKYFSMYNPHYIYWDSKLLA